MNPYSIFLFGLPAILVIAALFRQKQWQIWLLLIAAILVYWYVLPKYTLWSYQNPFNPNDGAALTFAALFGWLYGLIYTLILYAFGRLIKYGFYRYRLSKKPN